MGLNVKEKADAMGAARNGDELHAEAETMLFGRGFEAWDDIVVSEGDTDGIVQCKFMTFPGDDDNGLSQTVMDVLGIHRIKVEKSGRMGNGDAWLAVSRDEYQRAVHPRIMQAMGALILPCNTDIDRPTPDRATLYHRVRGALMENGTAVWRSQRLDHGTFYERIIDKDFFDLPGRPCNPQEINEIAQVIMDQFGTQVSVKPVGDQLSFRLSERAFQNWFSSEIDFFTAGTHDEGVRHPQLWRERVALQYELSSQHQR